MNILARWKWNSCLKWCVRIALSLAIGSSLVLVRADSATDAVLLSERVGVVLPIHDTITDITASSLERRIAAAREAGATVLIFELNTPGGLVSSSIAIADLIKSISDLKTVAWVNTNAHSGGALVAVACEEIVMARSSRMGDSQVIMFGPEGVSAVPEELQPKAYTPVEAEFRASASLRGYSQVLSEAFVIPEREVWWLENIKTGQREFVFAEEKIKRLKEPDPDAPADDSPDAPAGEPEWKLVETYYDILLNRDVPALQPIVRDDRLLEMSAAEAHAYGFSKGVASNEDDLKARYALGSVLRLNPSWSESLAYWLTSMYVRGFLMVVILLSAYVEFHTPGVGLAGLVALIALAVFVGAPYMTGLANVWEILFIVGGIALLLLELFVIPGFGIAGISGLLLLVIGMLATFAPPEPGRAIPLYIPSLESTLTGLRQGLMMLVASTVVSIAGMVMLSRYLPRMPILRRIIPANPMPSEVAITDPYAGAARIGDLGTAAGPLRPAGKAQFGPLLVDVVTQGEYVDLGARLEVIERRGNRVVVRPVA